MFWINVNDKLPEISTNLDADLICFNGDIYMECSYFVDGFRPYNSWDDFHGSVIKNVTDWMIIKEPN